MSDMKCPFCQQELRPLAIGYCCDCGYCADKDLWNKVITTRKALDVAKYALKNIQEDMKERKDGDDIWEIQKNLHDYCKTTIKQITELEQKDVK